MADTASQPKFSLGLGSAHKAKLPINGVKRPHSALASGFDEEEDESHATSISHFDHKAGGAIDASRPKKDAPLVIQPQKNRDWKEASKRRRQQGPLPEQNQDATARIAAIEEAERKERDRSFGLNVMQSSEQAVQVDTANEQQEETVAAPAVAQTEYERAMDALMGRQKQFNLVVPAVSETDAFKNDFKSAPDMASLADYDRVPVEQFGAAMLRGMGWKDGDGVGLGAKKSSKAKAESLIRRPALLGIGAKPDAAVDAELGGWGKAARGKEIKIYNPVLLKDKKTGELFTEDELQKKKENAQRIAFEEEFEAREKKREDRRRRDEREDDRERRHTSDRHKPEDKDRRRRHDGDRERSHRSRHDREDEERSHRSHRDDGRSRKERDYKHERRYRGDSRERRRERSKERRHERR